jgi:uncharacterized Zn finger protein
MSEEEIDVYDDYGFGGWWPRVSVASRRRQASQELKKRLKKGQAVAPVVINGRKIATTFWGKAWCDNLERYSDYANRLPRGRSYVRNGAVIDLQVAPGVVTSLVSGSRPYDVKVAVAKVPAARWKAMCAACTGAIDSVIELLQGRLSASVMERLCQEKAGLFPAPKEIVFTCSCPDWAGMCKHVAATLYGIGARLDEKPELLFTLRQVVAEDLVARAGDDLSKTTKRRASRKVLVGGNLSEIFGLDLQPEVPPAPRRSKKAATPAGRPKAPRTPNVPKKRDKH